MGENSRPDNENDDKEKPDNERNHGNNSWNDDANKHDRNHRHELDHTSTENRGYESDHERERGHSDVSDHRIRTPGEDGRAPSVASKPDFVEIEMDEMDGRSPPVGQAVLQKQANSYAAKKTVAQGMMDIALITANANQLRYILEFFNNSPTFYLNIVLIVISLILQVGVGVSLIFKGRFDMRGESKHRHARRINNYVVVAVFLVTIINVFIASFTVTGSKNGALSGPTTNQLMMQQSFVPQPNGLPPQPIIPQVP